MSNGKNHLSDTDAVYRAMRKMLLEAPAAEVDALASERTLSARTLSETGRTRTKSTIAEVKRNRAREETVVVLHKGLNSLLLMLRRRDNLDEAELALKANVQESEIKRIEFDPNYLPSPRTIFNLEKVFSLPSGVLAKLSGAVVHHSPAMEERVMEFAANAKSMGKLTKEEKQLLNAFVEFLTEQK
jgi:hypothetical protein